MKTKEVYFAVVYSKAAKLYFDEPTMESISTLYEFKQHLRKLLNALGDEAVRAYEAGEIAKEIAAQDHSYRIVDY
jgi:hypothetical protein